MTGFPTRARFAPRRQPLLTRLYEKIHVVDGVDTCWPWIGGTSQSGRRAVFYGVIQEGSRGSKVWRVNRLVLLLAKGEQYTPMEDGEDLMTWLHRADQWARLNGWEASHTCDTSLCARPLHLEWKDHATNVREQKNRQRDRR